MSVCSVCSFTPPEIVTVSCPSIFLSDLLGNSNPSVVDSPADEGAKGADSEEANGFGGSGQQ